MGIKLQLTKRRLLGVIAVLGGGGYYTTISGESTQNPTEPPEFWGDPITITPSEERQSNQLTIENNGPTVFNFDITSNGRFTISLTNIVDGTQKIIYSGVEDSKSTRVENLKTEDYFITANQNVTDYTIEILDYPIVDEGDDRLATAPIHANSDKHNFIGPIEFTPNQETVFELTPSTNGEYRIEGYDKNGTLTATLLESTDNTTQNSPITESYQLSGIGYLNVIGSGGWKLKIRHGDDLQRENPNTNQTENQTENKTQKKYEGVVLSDKSMSVEGNRATITGTATNDNPSEKEHVFVTAEVYNSNGEIIGSNFAVIAEISPQESETFVIDVELDGSADRFVVEQPDDASVSTEVTETTK